MKILLIAALMALTVLLVSCGDTIIIESQDNDDEISIIEQIWIDVWVDEGNSVASARCIWRISSDHYGSETAYWNAYIEDGDSAIESVVVSNPDIFDCWKL